MGVVAFLVLSCLFLEVESDWYVEAADSERVQKVARKALELFEDSWTHGMAQRLMKVEHVELNVRWMVVCLGVCLVDCLVVCLVG